MRDAGVTHTDLDQTAPNLAAIGFDFRTSTNSPGASKRGLRWMKMAGDYRLNVNLLCKIHRNN